MLKTTTIYNNKTTIPKVIRERLKVKNGDGIIWEINGLTIIVKKNEEKKSVF